MAELSLDWVLVREGQRTLCYHHATSWDRTTFLAALSSDPRTFDELSNAWSRYRSEPLSELGFQEWDETKHPPAGWLWLDLTHQQFAFVDTDPGDSDDLTPGAYSFGKTSKKTQTIWLNIPPWWRRLSFVNFAEMLEQNQLASAQWIPPFDFRDKLYGREMAGEIARQVIAIQWPAAPPSTAKEGGVSQAFCGRVDEDVLIRKLNRRVQKLVKRVHIQWLMTPRDRLNGRTPREFLHEYREWKDRELDYRRAQWSRTRVPPPAVPRESLQFRFGPMGTEEVVMYFDMIRDLIMAAWRWVDDEPRITVEKLTDDLLLYVQGWLSSSDPDEGSGEIVRDIIDLERSLTPRLASNEPIDCDCPLCRLQANEELFGPAFTICDGYHLEMEDEFAFSLEADRKMWEMSRFCEEFDKEDDDGDDDGEVGYLVDDAASGNDTNRGDTLDVDDKSGESDRLGGGDAKLRRELPQLESGVEGRRQRMNPATVSMFTAPARLSASETENDKDRIWTSSHIDPRPAPPELSLFAIGARLAELIDRLKTAKASRKLIDDLNGAFDEMSMAIRNWMIDKSTGKAAEEFDAMNQVVDRMVAILEACALAVPEITSQSADLQSLVHEWQRQLQA